MKNYKRYIMLVLVLLNILTVHIAVSAPQNKTEESITNEIISPAVTAEIESQPQQDSRQDIHYDKSEIELLARVIQGESLAEDYIGKVAVGAVILNRMEYRNQSMKTVVYAKNQFSSIGGRLFNMEIHEDCWNAAIVALDGADPTDGAEYFINPKHCNPSWTKNLISIKTIGNHKFYKRK